MVVMSLVYAAGRLSGGRRRPIAATGRGCWRAAWPRWSRLTSCSPSHRRLPLVFAGAALWGLHMGLTQGLLSALVAAMRPRTCAAARSACSTSACGVALLSRAGSRAGLWDAFGPQYTFLRVRCSRPWRGSRSVDGASMPCAASVDRGRTHPSQRTARCSVARGAQNRPGRRDGARLAVRNWGARE